MASPKRPTNNQRRTLAKQSLISQTDSAIESIVPHAASPSIINLTLPVFGSPLGLEISSIDATGSHIGTSPTVVSPTQLSATFAVLPIAIFISNSGGLRTSSNGSIDSAPVTA
jgi:hypothetical protein